MKKRLLLMIFALTLAVSALTTLLAAEENSDGAVRIYTLFNMNGGFIAEDPMGTSEPWLLVGKDVFMTDNGGYPAPFDNTYDKPSFYYLAGSNSKEWLVSDKGYTDYLASDFVIEYVVDYDEASLGAVSIIIAYNYDYYIELCVAPDGCGDIKIIAGNKTVSVLDGEGTLDANDPSKLLTALSGDNLDLPDRLAVSVKASLGENKMPKQLDVYVNGMLVGKTNAGFEASVESLTPTLDENGSFPKDKLGNIVALKISPEATGNINGICIYSLGENSEPCADAQAYYAEIYGNSSFKADEGEDITSDPEASTPENDLDDGEGDVGGDVIVTVVLIMAALSAFIAIIAIIILILRKKY